MVVCHSCLPLASNKCACATAESDEANCEFANSSKFHDNPQLDLSVSSLIDFGLYQCYIQNEVEVHELAAAKSTSTNS